MEKKHIFLIIIAIVVVAGTGLFLLNNSSESKCNDMYDKIRSAIEDANYCEVDSDCKTLILGGTYIDFGCYHFINSDIDESIFYEKMRDYADQCVEIINLCAPAPDAKCVSNKCVYVE